MMSGWMGKLALNRDGEVGANTVVEQLPRIYRTGGTQDVAIGTVNRKKLESLLARGLDEDEAVDLIIRGLIR